MNPQMKIEKPAINAPAVEETKTSTPAKVDSTSAAITFKPTASYENPYDFVYDTYKNDKNFNLNTWNEAFRRGEQDQYVYLLSMNKGKDQRAEFYDPKYFNYENQLLSLYENGANDSNPTPRVVDAYDAETGTVVKKNLGKMTDKAFLRYQLDEATAYRKAQLDRDIARMKRDETNGFYTKFWNPVKAIWAELGEATLKFAANMQDLYAALNPYNYALKVGDDLIHGRKVRSFGEMFMSNFTDGWTAKEAETVRADLSNWELNNTYFIDWDTGEFTNVGKYTAGMANTIGYMLPSIVVGALTGGASLAGSASSGIVQALAPSVGSLTMYSGMLGGRIYENATDPKTANTPAYLQVGNAIVSVAGEYIIEIGLAKLIGASFTDRLQGITGGKVDMSSLKNLQGISGVTKGLTALGKSAIKEGTEEFLQDFGTHLVNVFTDMIFEGANYADDGVNFQTLVDSFVMGALCSVVMSFGAMPLTAAREARLGRTPTVDGKPMNLITRFAFNEALEGYNDAVEMLAKGEGSIDLAHEVVTATETLAQYFNELGADRVKNMTKLLSRLEDVDTSVIGLDKEYSAAQGVEERQTMLQLYGISMQTEIYEMFKSRAEVAKKLREDGKVSKFLAFFKKGKRVDKNGITLDKSTPADVSAVEATEVTADTSTTDTAAEEIRTENTIETKLDPFNTEYDSVVITDGHIALEADGILYISEAWLENYSASEIYEFLSQNRIMQNLLQTKGFAPLLREVTNFVIGFTSTMQSKESALMQFLFNESVYRAFLLGDNGKNLHKYGKDVFGLFDAIRAIATKKGISSVQSTALNKVLDRVRETWKGATIAGILNWNIAPDSLHADSILTEADREFVKAYREKRNATSRRLTSSVSSYRGNAERLVAALTSATGVSGEEIVAALKMSKSSIEYLDAYTALSLVESREGNNYYSANQLGNVFVPIDADIARSGMAFGSEAMVVIDAAHEAAAMYADYFAELKSRPFDALTDGPRLTEVLADIEQYVANASGADILALQRLHTDNDGSTRFEGVDYVRGLASTEFLIDTLVKTDDTNERNTRFMSIVNDVEPSAVRVGNVDVNAQVVDAAVFLNTANGQELSANKELPKVVILPVDDTRAGNSKYLPEQNLIVIKQTAGEDLTHIFVHEFSHYMQTIYGYAMGGRSHSLTYDSYKNLIDSLPISSEYLLKVDKSVFDTQESFMRMIGKPAMNESLRNLNTLAYRLLSGETLSETSDNLAKSGATFMSGKHQDILLPNGKRIRLMFADKDHVADYRTNLDDLYDFARFYGINNTVLQAIKQAYAKPSDTEEYRDAALALKLLDMQRINSLGYSGNTEATKRFKDSPNFGVVYQPVAMEDVKLSAEDKAFLSSLKPMTKGTSTETIQKLRTIQERVYKDTGMYLILSWGLEGDEVEVYTTNILKPLAPKDFLVNSIYSNNLDERNTKFADFVRNNGTKGSLEFSWNDGSVGTAEYFELPLYKLFKTTWLSDKDNGISLRLVDDIYLDTTTGTDTDAWFDTETYQIVMRKSLLNTGDPLSVIIHEASHAMQDHFDYAMGGESDITGNEAFMTYLIEHYPLTLAAFDFNEPFIRYFLLSGEAMSFTQDVSDRLSYNEVMYDIRSGKRNILTPEGQFIMAAKDYDERQNISNARAGYQNAMVNSFVSIIQNRKTDATGTYHSLLTKESTYDINEKILSDKLSPYVRSTITLDEILRNPQKYLDSSKFSATTEEEAYAQVRAYLEKEGTGVSIDRDASTHEYHYVNDDAFTDLYKKAPSDELVKDGTYNTKDFYTGYLADTDINIIVDPNVSTETRYDKNGISVYIKSSADLTEKKFMQRLNHEMRHVLQIISGFEGGFTPDFKVSKKMITDLKAHVPEIFSDENIVEWAKAFGGDTESVITQQFIYALVGGEMNAYGLDVSLLGVKPIYVTEEAGRPTIFMPWYDKETGDGRYTTSFIAARASDKKEFYDNEFYKKEIEEPHSAAYKKALTRVGKRGVLIPEFDKKAAKDRIVNGASRYFSKEEAKGTNLIHFYKKDQVNSMDPDLKSFIKDSRAIEGELPIEIVHAIKKGKLTKQGLFRWFREVPLDNINQATFDLINKSFFKNTSINSPQELQDLTSDGPAFFWALAYVLRKEGLPLQQLVEANSVELMKRFLAEPEGEPFKKALDKKMNDFESFAIVGKDGNYHRVVIPVEDKSIAWLRVLMMQYYDGSLASGYYVGNAFRNYVKSYQNREEQSREVSINAAIKEGEESTFEGYLGTTDGDSDGDFESRIVDESDARRVGNSILALYELDTSASRDEMMQALYAKAEMAAVRKVRKELSADPEYKKLSPTLKSARLVKEVKARSAATLTKLVNASDSAIARAYAKITTSEMLGIQEKLNLANLTDAETPRVNVVNSIKNAANWLIKQTNEGKLVFSTLPQDVQDMFEFKEYVDPKTRKKVKVRQLKPEVYSVGRGTPTGAAAELTERNRHTHDMTSIIEARDKIVAARKAAVKNLFTAKDIERNLKKAAKNKSDLHEGQKAKVLLTDNGKQVQETKIVVQKTHETVNIISNVAMPDVLNKIFNTSFNEMVGNRVQFASRDAEGNLYEKGTKKYKSALEHERVSWKNFYEINRKTLLDLTRSDVMDIMNFYENGNPVSVGSQGKINAFKLFLEGYFVDLARSNALNWNFSEDEIKELTRRYELDASTMGSGLAAVKQMLDVINPYRSVAQRMLEEFDIEPEELDPLIKAVESMRDTTGAERDIAVENVTEELKKVEAMMLDGYYKNKTLWTKIKDVRYVGMLSSPITALRNMVSNYAVRGLNTVADKIQSVIFRKKGYREEQWDVSSNVKVTDEVEQFVETYITTNPIFDDLYDSTKYSSVASQSTQKSLFVSMVVGMLQERFAVNHRFETPVMQGLSWIVSKAMSDKKFIKLAADKYFKRLLTTQVAKGEVKLDAGLTDEVLHLFAESVILANADYMHKQSGFGAALRALKSVNPKLYEAVNILAPFLNSQWNWFVEAFKYTPIGLLGSIIELNRLEKNIDRAANLRGRKEMSIAPEFTQYLLRRDVGKGIVGMMLSGFGAMLAALGVMGIRDDDDKIYVYVGDVKVDITNVFGSSSVLMGAGIVSMLKDNKSFTDVITQAVNAMLDGFILKDVLERYKYDSSFLDTLLNMTESTLKSFVPQFWQLIVRMSSMRKVKYSKGFLGAFERWVNSFVPGQPAGRSKINPYTGKAYTKYSLPVLGELLRGTGITWDNISDGEMLCQSLGVDKGELTGSITVDGKKQTIKDIEALNKKYGELNAKDLAVVEKTRGWSRKTDKEKAKTLESIFARNAEIAKIYQWTAEGHHYYASGNLYKDVKNFDGVYYGDRGFAE